MLIKSRITCNFGSTFQSFASQVWRLKEKTCTVHDISKLRDVPCNLVFFFNLSEFFLRVVYFM